MENVLAEEGLLKYVYNSQGSYICRLIDIASPVSLVFQSFSYGDHHLRCLHKVFPLS